MIFSIINLNNIDEDQRKKLILIEVDLKYKQSIHLSLFIYFVIEDDGGIYKNRNNHRDRAHEIEETRDTKIDLPIDYRQVETVDEENLYGNPGANVPKTKPLDF